MRKAHNTKLLLTHFNVFEHRLYAPISDTTQVVRAGPEGTAPKLFLDEREGLKHPAGDCPFQGVSDL